MFDVRVAGIFSLSLLFVPLRIHMMCFHWFASKLGVLWFLLDALIRFSLTAFHQWKRTEIIWKAMRCTICIGTKKEKECRSYSTTVNVLALRNHWLWTKCPYNFITLNLYIVFSRSDSHDSVACHPSMLCYLFECIIIIIFNWFHQICGDLHWRYKI